MEASATTATQQIRHRVGGSQWDGEPKGHSQVYNPATGAVTGLLSLASSADTNHVVQTAKEAFPEWRQVPLGRRARIMFAFRELMVKNQRKFAQLITAEHGKVLSDAEGEVVRGIEVIEFACGIPHLLKGEYSEAVSTDVDSHSVRQPLGVVAGITPFNFPAMVPMWMFPMALACGNCFILKPSEKVPSAANLMAELLHEAGLPPGVFSVLHGDKEAVDALLAHDDVASISFVGSTPVAKHVYETGCAAGKRVQALGGAKNHMIVLPDADLDAAADAVIGAAYGSAGERCMAVSALVAVDPVGDALVEKIRERAAAIRTAPGIDESAEMGPLITLSHRDRVAGYVELGMKAGATLVLDGRSECEGQGFFLGPCLFDNVTPDMAIYRDEIFGPVLSVLRAPSYEEALRLVNENPYGNGVALFTRDGGAARRFEFEVEAGMVGINIPIPVPMAYYSFGGWGNSLFGDIHVHGMEGVRFYTRLKTISTRFADPSQGGANLGFPVND
jgi:malonate-semialdehyde dehydrogenase (acetylating)/methylmalonate-semialdehyde dehydrogenase